MTDSTGVRRPIVYLAGAMQAVPRSSSLYAEQMLELTDLLRRHGVDVVNGVMWEWMKDSTQPGGSSLTPREIYAMDVAWIKGADMVVANVDIPSHGVGYEIGLAEALDKTALVYHSANNPPSPMLRGNPSLLRYEVDPRITHNALAERLSNLIYAQSQQQWRREQ